MNNITIGADGPYYPFEHKCCKYITTFGLNDKLYDIYYCPRSILKTISIVNGGFVHGTYPNVSLETYDDIGRIEVMARIVVDRMIGKKSKI